MGKNINVQIKFFSEDLRKEVVREGLMDGRGIGRGIGRGKRKGEFKGKREGGGGGVRWGRESDTKYGHSKMGIQMIKSDHRELRNS